MKHWQDKVDLSKQKAEKLNGHLSMLLTRHFNEMTEYLELGKLKQRFDLKKLPIWGDQVEMNEINFEWPTT